MLMRPVMTTTADATTAIFSLELSFEKSMTKGLLTGGRRAHAG
jgi:hypothetical protein